MHDVKKIAARVVGGEAVDPNPTQYDQMSVKDRVAFLANHIIEGYDEYDLRKFAAEVWAADLKDPDFFAETVEIYFDSEEEFEAAFQAEK